MAVVSVLFVQTSVVFSKINFFKTIDFIGEREDPPYPHSIQMAHLNPFCLQSRFTGNLRSDSPSFVGTVSLHEGLAPVETEERSCDFFL